VRGRKESEGKGAGRDLGKYAESALFVWDQLHIKLEARAGVCVHPAPADLP
jgi:hypothetical protein